MPTTLEAETLHRALARIEECDHDAAVDSRAALAWLGWNVEGAVQLRRYDVQLFLWYELPTKVLASLERKHATAAALGRLLELTPAAAYAPLCVQPETLGEIERWEADDTRARRGLRRLLDASGIEPPDTPQLAWSSIMGPVEAQVRDDVAYALELALEAGTLAPGTPGLRRRQAEVMAAVLAEREGHASRLEAVHAERLRRWRDDHRSPARTRIIDRVADALARPPAPAELADAVAAARWLLEQAAEGIALTPAGYRALRTGLRARAIGPANRL